MIESCETFLREAVPLNKLDHFRELLEENGLCLTDRRHMSDIVPLVHQEECELLKSEISDKRLSVVFDGTTQFWKAMAIIVRFVGMIGAFSSN